MAICDGSLLSIPQNTALFSLIGTTYGGNGQSNFALPDLRGRVPVGSGSGPGRSSYVVGQVGGNEQVTLTVPNLASQNMRVIYRSSRKAEAWLRKRCGGGLHLHDAISVAFTSPATISLGGVTTQAAGNSTPFSVLQPYLSMNYYICLQGIFPSRN